MSQAARRPGLSLRPARMIAIGFVGVIAIGTILLSLPAASATGTGAGFIDALFTATSATTVTGLIVVDIATHWSLFGEIVVMALIQIGGFGVMALATLLGLLVMRRVGLRMQMAAQSETHSVEFGDGRRAIRRVFFTSVAVEAVLAVILSIRFAVGYDESGPRAIFLGVFHSISAFNNAGFALFSDNMMSFVDDAWIILPLSAGLVIGGIGFPVLFELGRAFRRMKAQISDPNAVVIKRPWFSLHVRLTIVVYAGLAVLGIIALTASEWTNPATLGPLDVGGKLLGGIFAGLSPRTAGFNSIDVAGMTPASQLMTDLIMFIGGGSGGTAGGIKVTTFAILGFVILSEIRGEPSVHAMKRRISPDVQRQAITVALLGVGAVMASTLTLLYMTDFSLDAVLMESVSAFATAGLSTGITAAIPVPGQLMLVVLMLLGRLGPVTLASALALRERARRYERPEERPIVG